MTTATEQKKKTVKQFSIIRIAADIFRVPMPRTPIEWAEANMVLPPDSAEPGRYRGSRTPYMIPIGHAVIYPRFKRVILVCGSQMSKTTFLFAVIGHRIDDDPVPIMYIGATQKLTKSVSKDRFMKMVDNCESLKEKLYGGKENKIEEKFFAGTRVGFAWGSSANELKSHPAGLGLVDERDGMNDDVDGEGDPVELMDARTTTYSDGKLIVASSPTVEDNSPIWSLYEEGLTFKWAWACPECGEYFVPCLERLKWPDKCTPNQAEKLGFVECPHCLSEIHDYQKNELNQNGKFVDPDGNLLDLDGKEIFESVKEWVDHTTIGFWVSGLASPWRTFGECAKKFLQAVKSNEQTKIQAVLNTVFGELYKLEGDAPEWEDVAELKQPYPFMHVPDGVLVITCGVDVQKDRLVFSVRGWGENMESWQVYSGEIWGETDQDQVWEDLEETLIATSFQKSDGTAIPIHLMGVDSGYRSEMVYAFCKKNIGRAVPCKGHDQRGAPVTASRIEVNLKGQRLKGSIQLWHVDDSYFKSWLFGRIQRPPEASGGWHLSQDATDDYCQQIVAEQLVTKPSGKMIWIKTKKDNHYLDCEKLNVACAHILHVSTMRKEGTLRSKRRVRSQGVTL